MLRLAAREANIVNVNFRLDAGAFGVPTGATGMAATTGNKIAVLRDAAGPRFDELELSVTVFVAVVSVPRRVRLGGWSRYAHP